MYGSLVGLFCIAFFIKSLIDSGRCEDCCQCVGGCCEHSCQGCGECIKSLWLCDRDIESRGMVRGMLELGSPQAPAFDRSMRWGYGMEHFENSDARHEPRMKKREGDDVICRLL